LSYKTITFIINWSCVKITIKNTKYNSFSTWYRIPMNPIPQLSFHSLRSLTVNKANTPHCTVENKVWKNTTTVTSRAGYISPTEAWKFSTKRDKIITWITQWMKPLSWYGKEECLIKREKQPDICTTWQYPVHRQHRLYLPWSNLSVSKIEVFA